MASIISADSGLVSGVPGLKTSADATGALQIQTGNNVTAITVDAIQNVGIGTTSPLNFGGTNLQVQNSAVGSIVWSNGTYIGQLLASASAEVTIGSRSNHPLRLGTNDTERMRIDSTGQTKFSYNAVVEVTDNTNAALRITQLGTGNALLVEDTTNPDSSPVLVDASGQIVQGYTVAINNWNGAPDSIASHSTSSNARPSVGLYSWSSNTARVPGFYLYKSVSNTVGTQGAVSNLQALGRLVFSGDDGATFIRAAEIDALVDGTPGLNDMPGALRFNTTPDGASAPIERVRISSTGQTKFSYNAVVEVTDNTNAALRITQLGTGNALLVEDSTNPDSSPFMVNSTGQVVVGDTSLYTSAGVTGGLQVTGASADSATIAINSFRNSTNGPFLTLSHSKSGVVGTQTALVQNDAVGLIRFSGSDGTAFIQAAAIDGFVDGTPGTSDMPGRLVFSTTADGASTPTERMRINSSGYVGIGTASPSSPLNVVSASSSLAIAINGRSSDSLGAMYFYANNGTTQYSTITASATEFRLSSVPAAAVQTFYTNGTERMRIDSSGNVGIGTTSPDTILNIQGLDPTFLIQDSDEAGDGFIKFKTANGTQRAFIQAAMTANVMLLGTGTSEAMRIDSSGNVGIGTASPAYKLDVVGTINVPADSSYTLGAGADRYIKYRSGNGDILYSFSAGNFYQQHITSSYHAWFTGNNERVRINDFGIGLGGAIPTSGIGITFPASQSASTNVNTLDDYEEGSWTPNVSGASVGSFTTKVGTYVKIGKQVTIWFRCDHGNSGSGGATQYVEGLPFNVGTYSEASMVGSMGTNGPTERIQNLLTLTANRAVLYVYIGGSQETTTITYASGTATYFID